jgi:hypothetical protein
MDMIELYCTRCREIFPEADAMDGELCPFCMNDSLFERETQDQPIGFDIRPALKAQIESDIENAKRYANVFDHFLNKLTGAK